MSYFGRRTPKLVWHPVDGVLIQVTYPGIKQISRNRETGTVTSLMDNRLSSEVTCDDGAKWGVVCDTHAVNICDYTLAGAKISQSYPTNFCEKCRELDDQGIVLTAAEATSPRVESMIRQARKLAGKSYPLLRKAGVTRVRRSLKAQGVLK